MSNKLITKNGVAVKAPGLIAGAVPRQEKGKALRSQVKRRSRGFIVPSSKKGKWHVSLVCDCPDFGRRQEKCKHVWAVEYYLQGVNQ